MRNSSNPFRDTCQPARPIQPSGQIFLHWAAATLKGLGEIQNKVLNPFLPLFLSIKIVNFKTRDFIPLIKGELAFVILINCPKCRDVPTNF